MIRKEIRYWKKLHTDGLVQLTVSPEVLALIRKKADSVKIIRVERKK